MDKPKINIKAWEPIGKRKEKLNFEIKNNLNLVKNPEKNQSTLEKINDNSSLKVKEPTWFDIEINERLFNAENINSSQINFMNTTIQRKKNKKNKLSFNTKFFSYLGAAIGAIFTGIIIGYVMLNYLVPTMFDQDKPNTVPLTNSTTTETSLPENDEILLSMNNINYQPVYFLQVGAFSEISGANMIITQQKQMGRTAVVAGQGPYYVYIGIGDTKENAAKLKDVLTSQGLEIYIKEYLNEEHNNELLGTGTYSGFINLGDQLVKLLSRESIFALDDPHYQINYKNLQDVHQQFLTTAQILKQELKNKNLITQEKMVDERIQQVHYAITAANAYKKSPNRLYLWNIQEQIMKYKLNDIVLQ